MENEKQNYAETIRDITREAGAIQYVNGLPFYRGIDGKMILLEAAAEKPIRCAFQATAHELGDYLVVLREISATVGLPFKGIGSAFLAGNLPHFDYYFDFCREDDLSAPGWGEIIARLRPSISRQLATWTAKNQQWISQAEFGDFIDVNIEDVHGNEAGKLLDVARNLEATVSSKFQSVIRPATGDMKLRWESETDSGEMRVPQEFAITIPLYQYGEAYKLVCALQYRVREGAAQFRYRITNLEAAVEDNFEDWRNKVEGAGYRHFRGQL